MQIEDQEQEILLEPEVLSSVISVNGKTGNVVLTTSDLENDSDYQTGEDVQNALEGAIGTGTLTVQKNSTTVGTFNANANSDTTIDLSVPTTISELTNDSNYQTGNEVANSIAAHNQSSSAHQDIRQAITDEQNARINADNGLQGQIDAITSASDVVDIVGTYAALEAYDTQHLKDNDVIKVLQDETHNEAMSYYRWSTTTHTWTYIGSEGPYYTKSETNTLLDEKLDADEVPDGFFDGPATISPTPATSVEIEDSIKLANVQLDGDTFQQTYSGKNILPPPTNGTNSSGGLTFTITDNTISASGVVTGVPPAMFPKVTISPTMPSGNFTFSIAEPNNYRIGIILVDDNNTNHSTDELSITPGQTSVAINTTYNITGYRLSLRGLSINDSVDFSMTNKFQLETGTVATSYEPYTGRTPAPNPDYPQNIDVVTGAQTITATDGDSQSQTYTIDLGSIELCKIGDYQDYIYKSGNDWYVHKNCGSITYIGDNSENWGTTTSGSNRLFYIPNSDTQGVGTSTPMLSNRFIYDGTANKENHIYNNSNKAIVTINPTSNGTLVATTVAEFKTWLSTNSVIVYYPLATPTDAQITDAGLVGQLNALLNATIYSPTTTMTSSGSLPVILDVTAFTDNLNSLLEIAAEPTPTGGATYTAGTGINISSDTISVDTTTIQEKLTAGSNISITSNTISATDTTYAAFVGTDGNTAGTAGLVPAPATTDAGKFLKADGTWDTAGGSSVNVVQTTGTSQANVMSQNATTSMVFADPSTKMKPQIGAGASASGTDSVALGRNAKANTDESVSIGKAAGNGSSNINKSVNIGTSAGYQISANISGSISLGAYSKASRTGELNIGSTNTSYGYNSTNYRVIGGVHDGQTDHDAVTVEQVNGVIDAINTALNTNIPHIGA